MCTRCDVDVAWAERKVLENGLVLCTSCHVALGGIAPLPWEAPGDEPVTLRFFRTVWNVSMNPRTYAEKWELRGDWLPPVVYGALCMGFFPTLAVILLFVTGDTLDMALIELFDNLEIDVDPSARRAAALLVPIIRVPIVYAVHAGLLSLALWSAGERTGYLKSARMLGYAYTGYVWLLLPPAFGVPWGFMLSSIFFFNGLIASIMHETKLTPWRALVTVTLFAVGMVVTQTL